MLIGTKLSLQVLIATTTVLSDRPLVTRSLSSVSISVVVVMFEKQFVVEKHERVEMSVRVRDAGEKF